MTTNAMILGGIGWRAAISRMQGGMFYYWGTAAAAASTSTFFMFTGPTGQALSATENPSFMPSPVPTSTMTAIRALHATNPLTVDSVTYTLRVNGVDTSLTCTVLANTTSAVDLGHTASTVLGDTLSIKYVQSGTESQASLNSRVAIRSEAANGVFWGWGSPNTVGNTTLRFMQDSLHTATAATVETGSNVLSARAHTLRMLVIYHNVACTTGDCTYTVRVNGVNTSITKTIPHGSTTANITTASASCAAGDRISLSAQMSTGDTTGITPRVALSAVLSGRQKNWDASVLAGDANTNFLRAGNNGAAPSTTEGFSKLISVVGDTVKNLYSFLAVATSTDTITATFRVNGVDTSMTCALTPGNTLTSDTAHSATYAAGDALSMKYVQSGTESVAGSAPRASVDKAA